MSDLLIHAIGALIFGGPGIALMAFIGRPAPTPTREEIADAR